MSDEFNHDRRRFFGTAAMTIAAGQLGTASPRVSRNTTIWKNVLPKVLPFPYSRSPLKVMPNGAPHAPPAVYRANLSGKYEHRDLTGGVGHNLPQEASQAFAEAILAVDCH
jgi:hypothetical protein